MHRTPCLLGLSCLAAFSRAAIIDIDIQNFAFSPSTVSIVVGDSVRWTNLDAFPHTVTSDSNLFDSGTLNQNDQFLFTFNSAGDFSYHCGFHPHMMGMVQVAAVPEPGTIAALGAGAILLIRRRRR
ncbi:MAG TPA: cupredoxin family copper-binding protein [Fimbriimonadaceae bacterium]|nr:cupredoxin family copper-binding protein [Fimbriimonadaceae bacterium]